jgi:hypothetical protein
MSNKFGFCVFIDNYQLKPLLCLCVVAVALLQLHGNCA